MNHEGHILVKQNLESHRSRGWQVLAAVWFICPQTFVVADPDTAVMVAWTIKSVVHLSVAAGFNSCIWSVDSFQQQEGLVAVCFA